LFYTNTKKHMKHFFCLLCLGFAFVGQAQTPRQPAQILITDIGIFNGKDNRITTANILIEGNRIKTISTQPIPTDRSAMVQVINGKGYYAMPGLIDAHTHLMFESIPKLKTLTADYAYLTLFAAKAMEQQLLRGFTTVRDLGGGALVLQKAVNDGLYPGPRIFASGAMISQTGGHADFGFPTDVTVHAYTPDAMQTAIRSGVRCIEHGQLADEATAKLMAEKGVWWCLQPFLDDEDANPHPEGSANRAKQIEMSAGTDNAYQLAKKYKIKTAFGTDCLFDASLAKRQGKQLAKLTRWYTPFEVLKMATYDNAQLLAMSGKRSPYLAGKLGEISEGAYADLIIVNGNPLENIQLIVDPEQHFKVIVKDGVVYKNTLGQ